MEVEDLRGNLCTNSDEPPLTALVSDSINMINTPDENSKNYLYWYLPETNATKAEFVIVEKGKFIYAQEFEIPQNTKGVVKLDLPSDLNFKEDVVYKWELALVCQEFDRSSDEYIYGAIQVLNDDQEVDLAYDLELAEDNPTQFEAVSVEEAKANIYISYNMWDKAFSLFSESIINPEIAFNPDSSLNESNINLIANDSSMCLDSDHRCTLLEYFGLDGNTDFIGSVNEDGFISMEE